MVQVYVSQLRKVLPAETLQHPRAGVLARAAARRGGSRALRARSSRRAAARSTPGDADERRSAAARGPRALAQPRAGRVRGAVRDSSRRHVSSELRLSALEERIDADLALGRHAELASELEALVARHPLRERLRGQRCSRSTARAARPTRSPPIGDFARRALRASWGSSPRARLRELERPDPAAGPRPRGRREGSSDPPPARPSRMRSPSVTRPATATHRLPGRRRGPARPRARARLGVLVPARLGVARARVLLPAACRDGPADPLRQARDGSLRPGVAGELARPRGAHGRRARRDGRGRVRARGARRRLGRRARCGRCSPPPTPSGRWRSPSWGRSRAACGRRTTRPGSKRRRGRAVTR